MRLDTLDSIVHHDNIDVSQHAGSDSLPEFSGVDHRSTERLVGPPVEVKRNAAQSRAIARDQLQLVVFEVEQMPRIAAPGAWIGQFMGVLYSRAGLLISWIVPQEAEL